MDMQKTIESITKLPRLLSQAVRKTHDSSWRKLERTPVSLRHRSTDSYSQVLHWIPRCQGGLQPDFWIAGPIDRSSKEERSRKYWNGSSINRVESVTLGRMLGGFRLQDQINGWAAKNREATYGDKWTPYGWIGWVHVTPLNSETRFAVVYHLYSGIKQVANRFSYCNHKVW